jgi:hypothetical protein
MHQRREPCLSWMEQNYLQSHHVMSLECAHLRSQLPRTWPLASRQKCLQTWKEVARGRGGGEAGGKGGEGVMWGEMVAMHLIESHLDRFRWAWLMAVTWIFMSRFCKQQRRRNQLIIKAGTFLATTIHMIGNKLGRN